MQKSHIALAHPTSYCFYRQWTVLHSSSKKSITFQENLNTIPRRSIYKIQKSAR